MPPERQSGETVSAEELSHILADATETTAEEIEQGVEGIEIAPPEEAEVVDTTE